MPPTVRVAFVSPVRALPDDKAVLFADTFDTGENLSARYFEYGSQKGSFVWSANAGYGGQGGAMRCRFEKGQVEAGSLKVVFGKNPFGKGPRQNEMFREIYWRVYVKHEPGWEGNPAKLARATCLASPDWTQGLIAHVWGGKGDALCIDPASGIRDGRKVSTRYNDFANLRWLGLRNTQTPIFSPVESGRWVCIESHVRLNTPGKSDGVFELWIDGKKEAARTDLDWHGTWADYGINAVFLENYWNDGAVKAESRWFDDFVISTRPVGPVRTGTAPTLTRVEGQVGTWRAQAAADPEGKEIVWTSQPAEGMTLRLDAAHGTFGGRLAGKSTLASGADYWLRVQQRLPDGSWSAWSSWHSPFHTTP